MTEDLFKRLYDLGAPDKAIARICEVSHTRVRLWRVANDLPVVDGAFKYADQKRGAPGFGWEDLTPIRKRA